MKRLLASIFVLTYCISLFFANVNIVKADDLLESAFQESIANEHIIMLGNGKNAVGNEVFREGADINSSQRLQKVCFINGTEVAASDEQHCLDMGGERKRIDIETRPPLIVSISKFLLRMTIVLGITMVLYNGVMYIVESMKGTEAPKKATTNIVYVAAGIVLALSSVGLVNLISSISISSLRSEDEYMTDSFREKLTEFCDFARLYMDVGTDSIIGRSPTEINAFCNNQMQPAGLTQEQWTSIVGRALDNPGDWGQQDFLYFLEWIEGQYGYTIDLSGYSPDDNTNNDNNNNNNTPTEYGEISDIVKITQRILVTQDKITITMQNTSNLPVSLAGRYIFVSCNTLSEPYYGQVLDHSNFAPLESKVYSIEGASHLGGGQLDLHWDCTILYLSELP